MSEHDIYLTEQAERDLQSLDPSDEERIRNKIEDLRTAPDHFGKPLKGPRPLWSLKIGRSDWRVIYKIQEDHVLIIAIGHRRNIYDNL